MKKSIRYIILFVVAMTAGLWTCLQFEAVQTWAKSKAHQLILQETGCSITTGTFGGAPPFLLSLDNVELLHPDIGSITIDSVTLMPSWFEMMFGRLSFVWITANGVDLTRLKVADQEHKIIPSKTLLPPVSCAIHSLHIDDIRLPKAYYELLLNTYSDQSTVDCVYSLSGCISWSPRKEKLSASISVTPYAGSSSPLTVDTTLVANPITTTISTSIDALKVGDGSVFFSLPCDRLSLETTLNAKTQDLLQVLFGSSNKTPNQTSEALFTGSWNLSGIHREKKQAGLNPVLRFSAAGNFTGINNESFSFETTELSCQKIEPIQSYTQNQKEQLSQELLLANADDPQDASTLSRITNIPTPRSIQGSLTCKDSTILATLSASSLQIGDHSIPSIALAISRQANNDGSLKAEVSILHNSNEIPVTFSANFSSNDAFTWQLPKVSIAAANHEISGNLNVSLFPFELQGKLESKSSNAHLLAELLGGTIGKLHCLATFDTEETEEHEIPSQKIDLQVTLDALTHKAIRCSKALLVFSSKGLLSNLSSKTSFTASNIENESLHLHTVQLDAIQDTLEPLPGYTYSVDIDGQTIYGPCKLASTGRFNDSFFTLNTFKAISGGHTITNNTPLHIAKDNDSLRVYPFEFTSDTNMSIFGDALISDSPIKASLTWSNLPLECFDPFLNDITLFGNVSGHLELSGKRYKPQLVITAASSAVSLWNPNKTNALPLTASCEVTLHDGQLHITSEVEGLSLKKPALFELTAPLEFSSSSISFSDSKKLSGHLLAEFDSHTILSSYLDEDEIMEGIVEIDARLAGIASNPVITGSMTWNEGKLFIPCLGTLFNSVQMSSRLQDNTLLIEQLSAKDANNGTFAATGWIKNLLGKKMHYQLDASTQKFAAIALDDVSTTATGNFKITGDLAHTDFTGTFDVSDASFLLSPTLSKDIPKLDITYIGPQNDLSDRTNKSFLFGLDLDLTLNNGIVRGMGLESSWKGNARVKGQNKNIDVEGKILLDKGTLDFAGKRFTLTQGSLEFHGDLYKKSNLHVLAANDVGAITTQVMLQGPLESPRIVIQSNPAMSQKEILSWLLFNKSSSDISPIQGIQLGHTLLKLKGSNGGDMIEEIKQKLHIDRIDFGATPSAGPLKSAPGSSAEGATNMQDNIPNEVSVQVGKYISDGVIVTLSKDVTNEVNRVGIEANLTNHITAQANVGDDAQTELSLEWKLRY